MSVTTCSNGCHRWNKKMGVWEHFEGIPGEWHLCRPWTFPLYCFLSHAELTVVKGKPVGTPMVRKADALKALSMCETIHDGDALYVMNPERAEDMLRLIGEKQGEATA